MIDFRQGAGRRLAAGVATLTLAGAAIGVSGGVADGAAVTTTRVSVGPQGQQIPSGGPGGLISSDGHYLLFGTADPILDPRATNGVFDVYRRDRLTGSTLRVSTGPGGQQPFMDVGGAAISHDGRYVVLVSRARNLVAGDTNNAEDVFVRDVTAGVTQRVSVGPGGVQANGVSEDAGMSDDGRYVVFLSDADNLVPDDTNNMRDIFVRDMAAGVTRRVSPNAGAGSQSPVISGNGRYVVFFSFGENVVPGDTNGVPDIFRYDLVTGAIRRVSVGAGGRQQDLGSFGRPAVSADGNVVAFSSGATNLVADDTNGVEDVFVRDIAAGTTKRVSVTSSGRQVGKASSNEVISGNGRYVGFESATKTFVPGDTNGTTDGFIHDLLTGSTRRVTVGAHGQEANEISFLDYISPDGRLVVFASYATNLVPGDTNRAIDTFVRG